MTQPIQIRTFRAKSLSEALARIRRELGPDAVILETKPAARSLLGLSNNRISVTATSNSPSANPRVVAQQAEETLQSPTHPSPDADLSRLTSHHDLSAQYASDITASSGSDQANPEDLFEAPQLPLRFVRSSGCNELGMIHIPSRGLTWSSLQSWHKRTLIEILSTHGCWRPTKFSGMK